MGLLPSAPSVQVFAPTTWFVGQNATIEIEVIAKDETKIDFIDIRALGRQGWSVGSGKSRVTMRANFPEMGVRVMDAGVLPAGTSRYAAQFVLPPGTAPSHELSPAWAVLQLMVHVSIPWWIDGRYRFEVPVRIPPPPRVERTPDVSRSRAHDAPATKPRLELSLASTRLIAGETLVGSCAIFHVDDSKKRDLDITLVPLLRLFRGNRQRERRAATYNLSIPIPAGSAGTNLPFQFRLPESMTPSFKTVTHELVWWLVASYGSFFGGKEEVAIPLEIVDASAAATTAQLQVAPRLADQRVLDAFDRFARTHGWTVATQEDDSVIERSGFAGPRSDAERRGDVIVRAVPGGDLGIGYSYRGKDGTFLVARLAHPSLGLGLSVTPSSSLRHVFFRDIEIDVDAWDRAHLVAARAAEQAIPFLQKAAPAAMAAIKAIGPLVRWDDDALVFERPVMSIESSELAQIALALDELATQVDQHRGAIPTPPGVSIDDAAFVALAERWRGRFTPGDLSIEGELDNAPIDLGLAWDETGNPYCIRASVGNPQDASEQARQLSLSMPRPASDALAATTPEPLVERLTSWPADFRDLVIHDGTVSASLVLAGSTIDAGRVRELVEALRAVLGALDPAASPYR